MHVHATVPLSWSPRSCLMSSQAWTSPSPFALGSGMDGPRYNAHQERPQRSARTSDPTWVTECPTATIGNLRTQSEMQLFFLQVRGTGSITWSGS